MAASLKNHAKLSAFVKGLLKDGYHRCISNHTVCKRNTQSLVQSKGEYSSQAEGPKIIIPDKIERSSTAILEALASTVKNDTNQPMYMMIDDPHLISTSDRVKKNYAASIDSGRKAAQKMLAMYPDYFTQIWEEPTPEALRNPFQAYENINNDESALLERLQKRKVKEAVEMFKACRAQGLVLSQETQEKLLELLTVFNCEDPVEISSWSNFVNPTFSLVAPFPSCNWRKGNMAEEVFHGLPEKTANAYSFLIRGMAENFDKEGALAVYREAKAANLPVDTYTYNKLLSVASLNCTNVEEIKLSVEWLLQDMVAADVKPNVDTFNAILSNCRRVSKWTGTRKFALSVLAEMKACGIEPTLGTYLEILHIFYYIKDKVSKTPELFQNLLENMKDKEYVCRLESDVLFFRNAIKVIGTFFPDSQLALKLYGILRHGRNSDALGHRQLTFTFYKELLMVISSLEHTDVVMDIYQNVAPYIFLPSSDVYMAMFENIHIHDSYHYVPQLFADIIGSSQFKDGEMLHAFVHTMATQKHEPQLQNQFSNIVSSLLQTWDERKLMKDNIALDGSVIGDMILIYLNNQEANKAWVTMQLYLEEKSLHTKHPSEVSMIKLTEHCISSQDYDSTKKMLTLMAEFSSSAVPVLVEQVLTKMELPPTERNFLQELSMELDSGTSGSDTSSSDSD